jgi:hypothetical protein
METTRQKKITRRINPLQQQTQKKKKKKMGPGNNLNEKLLSGPAPGSAPVGDDHGLTARVESFSRSGSEFATMVGQLGTKRDTRTLRASLAESRDQLSREAKALTAAFKDWSPVDRPARLRRDRLLRQLEKAVGGYRGAAQLSLRKERVLGAFSSMERCRACFVFGLGDTPSVGMVLKQGADLGAANFFFLLL